MGWASGRAIAGPEVRLEFWRRSGAAAWGLVVLAVVAMGVATLHVVGLVGWIRALDSTLPAWTVAVGAVPLGVAGLSVARVAARREQRILERLAYRQRQRDAHASPSLARRAGQWRAIRQKSRGGR